MQFYLILSLSPIALAAEMLFVPSSQFVFKLVSSTHAVDVDGMTKFIDVITFAFHYYSAIQNTPLFALILASTDAFSLKSATSWMIAAKHGFGKRLDSVKITSN